MGSGNLKLLAYITLYFYTQHGTLTHTYQRLILNNEILFSTNIVIYVPPFLISGLYFVSFKRRIF